MKTTPAIVRKSILKELWWLCASGSNSLAPIYKRNPAKKPRYNCKMLSGIWINSVERTPSIGATASRRSSKNARLSEFLFVNINVTVLSPSEKSCVITASAINITTWGLIWNPSPLPTPSKKLWNDNPNAPMIPTDVWWWSKWCKRKKKCFHIMFVIYLKS